MKQSTATYIDDINWDIRLPDPFGSEVKRQVMDIMKDVSKPVFSCGGDRKLTVVVGSEDIDCRNLGPDDHIVRTIGRNVHISGPTERAAAYGVFSFLEELGFYFLASRTVKPGAGGMTAVVPMDRTFRTPNTWRGLFLSYCMVSTSIMSLDDYERLFDNMLRMKMNRIIFYSFENEPIVDYTFRGERKLVGDISRPESGYFSYGRNWTGSYYTDEIKVGGSRFGRKKVAPLQFQEVDSSREALDTGKMFMNEIISMAASRGIGVWISFLPQFVSMNMTKYIKPMPRKNLHWSALVSCTDETVGEINRERIRNLVESYPGLEGLFIGIPEGFYEDPYPESMEYIDGKLPSYAEALELQGKYWGDHWPGKELQTRHIRADIAFTKTAVDAVKEARRMYPSLRLGVLTICKAYLLAKLHGDLPGDVAFCDIESRSLWTHGGAPLFLFRLMEGRECSIIPRITDDGSQAGMQFNLKLYHMDGYCRSSVQNGTKGLMMQTLHIRGADHNIKYLAEGLWNPEIEPDGFYREYIGKVYGDYLEGIAKAFHILEDNEIHMGGRGAANMPWNHVPPEIAVMRKLQEHDDPWHGCPLDGEYLDNASKRAAIYEKTISSLEEAAGLFGEISGVSEEARYMETRTRAYSAHLSALVQIIGVYSEYKTVFQGRPSDRDIEKLVEGAGHAHELALVSARLFEECVSHVTDLAVLWMINSSMITGTEVLKAYFNNILGFYRGVEYWNPVGWDRLFGECPYPAHSMEIKSDNSTGIYEPG